MTADCATIPVLLRGHLGAKYGKRFDLAVDSPAAAIRAMCYRLPGFKKYVSESKGGFKVLVADEPIGLDDLGNATGGKSIRIIPVVSGAKGDFGKILMGAAIIAVSFYTMGFGSTAVMGMMNSVGLSMVLGGVAGLLASSPNGQNGQDGNANQSYLFSGGGANPTGQGGKVPILIGRMEIAGIRISGGIDPEGTHSENEFGEPGDDGHGGHVITKEGI